MKIILSHDIDHLYWTDHFLRDTYIPKLIVRTALQRTKKIINTKTALARINIISETRLHRLDELMAFLHNHQIRSTFFIGFANGLNLSYTTEQALQIGERILSEGFSVGIHGIQYDNEQGIRTEKKKGQPLLNKQLMAGMRMHYLRYAQKTPELLAAAGYQYDSTEYRVADPYLIYPGLWSFPIGVMDCYAISPTNENLDIAKNNTLQLFEAALQKKLNYFVVNFHDVYFDDKGYANYKAWLVWLVNYLKDGGYIFTDFETAINDLQNNISNIHHDPQIRK